MLFNLRWKGGYRVNGSVCSTFKFKKQHSQNYKVKNIQVEDEIIDISGWSISPCYCHLGGQGFVPRCLINSSASQQGATVEPSRVNLDPTGVSTFHLLATETICLLLHMRGFLVPTWRIQNRIYRSLCRSVWEVRERIADKGCGHCFISKLFLEPV